MISRDYNKYYQVQYIIKIVVKLILKKLFLRKQFFYLIKFKIFKLFNNKTTESKNFESQ